MSSGTVVRALLVLSVVAVHALLVIGIVTTMDVLRTGLDAAHGRGVHGTVHVDERLCKNSGNCTLVGTFTSDDGTVRTPYQRWQDSADDSVHVGDELPGLVVGESDGVYRAAGSRAWVVGAFGLALLAAIELVWLWFFPVRRLLDRPPLRDTRGAHAA
ncbi:hypothetical protein ABT369_52975 [Dactylosporangium sp. NPDC000244]|uniref:hypothetical protein n=1 Tax=Dactylosporangium sp. NPDC000244 TaxID=3154365 RepID=UPI0033296FD2